MPKDKPETRSYSSPLRDRQREYTRRLIMEAVASFVTEGSIHTFSVQDVADRAGISYASVYRHFPTREALLEEMYEWASELAGSLMPAAPSVIEEIPAWIDKSIPVFEQHATIIQAVISVLAALNINPESKQRRDELIDKIVDESTPHLSQKVTRRTAAVIRYLAGSQGWVTLRRQFGLDAEDTAAALTWALEVLIRDLKRQEASVNSKV
ncbi:transcriptional regulator, TetR family [Desulfotomaculum arcticum]|uniref:Transcriptional regulator, TetR family n=1 Tax=Desulfotruncus arcticus DSM 17038 TaxID=1121424 RepID=A0A1I2X6J9_9FIRM|nr:TetR/AcrR family transcriptional regulator [Desulfotruncus arcticus]SFH09160.1 transcriptional regulator, TetR family [Desulfotomaculum arcticum] [Desulfotruncus arcticus DSM 17038]